MNPIDIATALTSGTMLPMLGAGLIILSWLIAKIRLGVPFKDQLVYAGKKLLGVAPLALSAGGLALLAGMPLLPALSATITAMLMTAGFSLPTPPKE